MQAIEVHLVQAALLSILHVTSPTVSDPCSHEQHGVTFAARMASPPKGPKRVYPPTPKEMTRHIGDMTSPTQLQPLLQKHPGRVGHIQLTAAVAQAAWLLREGVCQCISFRFRRFNSTNFGIRSDGLRSEEPRSADSGAKTVREPSRTVQTGQKTVSRVGESRDQPRRRPKDRL